jgi:hypothetical protein
MCTRLESGSDQSPPVVLVGGLQTAKVPRTAPVNHLASIWFINVMPSWEIRIN